VEVRDYSLADLPSVAAQVVAEMQHPVVLLFGSMGAGKTTLIKALCKVLLVEDEVRSPTYSLVNEYETEAGETIYRFDLYRLNSPEEALDFGVEEYLESGNMCLIEWPEKIVDFLPERFGVLKIEAFENSRMLVFRPSCGVGDLELEL